MKIAVDPYMYDEDDLLQLRALEQCDEVTLPALIHVSETQGVPIMLGDYDTETDTLHIRHPRSY